MDRNQKANYRKRKGQTMAEFALTLPILLLLVFGTIEFGRLFQAWVTIQNSAREATRFATTGAINEDIFDTTGSLPASGPEPILPCLLEDDQRGYLGTFNNGIDDVEIPIFSDTAGDITFEGFTPQRESIYAIYYGGADCEPTPESDAERRDILRIASTMMVARAGAGGLSLDNSDRTTVSGMLDEDYFATLPVEEQRKVLGYILMQNWTAPRRGANESRYFQVEVCSQSRPVRDSLSSELTPNMAPGEDLRYVWVDEDTQDVSEYPYLDGGEPIFGRPFCMLNEVPPVDDGGSIPPTVDVLGNSAIWNHAGLPWADAGGPSERIIVQVTYNHPLITPIGATEYITMRARRSGVTESFRSSRALAAPLDPPSDEVRPDTATPLPTNTPPPTPTPPPTATEIPPTATDEPTPTVPPFTCNDLGVEFQTSNDRTGQVYLDIFNYHGDIWVAEENMLELIEINIVWNRTGANAGMNITNEFLNDVELLWLGENSTGDFTLSTDPTASDVTGDEQQRFVDAYRKIPPLGSPPDQTFSYWTGTFVGAFSLAPSVFAGTTFTFFDPVTNTTCVVDLDVTPSDIFPTEDPDNPVTPTPTYTPNCSTNSITFRFVEFQEFGVVKLEVSSLRFQPSPLRDFQISWPDPSTLDPDVSGIMKLDKIVIGGINADDYGQPGAQGVLLWDGDDPMPTTTPADASTVFWRDNYLLPGQSTLPIYLDFSGTGSTLEVFGVQRYMFNNTWFDFGCIRGGGGDDGGGGPSDGGPVFIVTNTPPEPTNTPRPSRTPGPTRTPTPTRPTATPGPTNTPRPTSTDAPPTNTQAPTRPGGATEAPTDESGGPAD